MELNQDITLLDAALALMSGENNRVANLANLSALIMERYSWHWVGWYLPQGQELVLGPFQGPIACTRIAIGKGVCGSSWQKKKSLLVPDVSSFPGHIACSALSKSELVVPVKLGDEVLAILDIDSTTLNGISMADQGEMENLAEIVAKNWLTWV